MMGLRDFWRKLFEGRRGPDALSGALFGVGLVLSAVAYLTGNRVLAWLVYLPWILALLRMFSTRLEQRYQENQRFLQGWQQLKNGVVGLFRGKRPARTVRYPGTKCGFGFGKKRQGYTASQISYHHFVCPGCNQKLRVPRGRGKVLVTCPKCGRQFEEYA